MDGTKLSNKAGITLPGNCSIDYIEANSTKTNQPPVNIHTLSSFENTVVNILNLDGRKKEEDPYMALSVSKNGSLEAGTEVILESLDLNIAGKWKLNGEIDIENGNTLTNKDGITLKYNWILPYVEGSTQEYHF